MVKTQREKEVSVVTKSRKVDKDKRRAYLEAHLAVIQLLSTMLSKLPTGYSRKRTTKHLKKQNGFLKMSIT